MRRLERIENPWVLGDTPYDDEPLEYCESCGCEMCAGEKYFLIDGKYYCESCVETGVLEEEDYEPDWDSMRGGYDDWRGEDDMD